MFKYVLIIFQTILNTGAQLLLKKGVSSIDFGQPLFKLFMSLVLNYYIVGGAFVFGISFLSWLYLLSKFDLSFLYPTTSLSFVTTAFIGWLFLAETISLNRSIGIALIMLGVFFIAKS